MEVNVLSWQFWLGWLIGLIIWKVFLEKPVDKFLRKVFKR